MRLKNVLGDPLNDQVNRVYVNTLYLELEVQKGRFFKFSEQNVSPCKSRLQDAVVFWAVVRVLPGEYAPLCSL